MKKLIMPLTILFLIGCSDTYYPQNKESTIEYPSKQDKTKVILNNQNNDVGLSHVKIKIFNFQDEMNERRRTRTLDCVWGFADDKCYSNWLKRMEHRLSEMSNKYDIVKIDTSYGIRGEPITYSVWYRERKEK